MGTGADTLAVEFQRHRTHLLGVAYRLTGSLSDAEDAVQEAWLRLARLSDGDRAPIREPRGWLTTVVSRLCLDRLRSAVAVRERYVGTWLPEPLLTRLDGPPDPLDDVVRDEGVRMAALVVLERLTPEQRVAFVLHDALAVPFAEIADVLGCSVATARQHASRARRAARVQGDGRRRDPALGRGGARPADRAAPDRTRTVYVAGRARLARDPPPAARRQGVSRARDRPCRGHAERAARRLTDRSDNPGQALSAPAFFCIVAR